MAAGLQPGAWQWTHKSNSYTEANVSHGATPLQSDVSGQMCLASWISLQAPNSASGRVVNDSLSSSLTPFQVFVVDLFS